MHKLFFASVFLLLVNNAIAQYNIGPQIQQTVQTQATKQQLINYLLSNFNQAPLGERINVLSAAVQQIPPKRTKRVYLADVLKNSALQSLMVAASVCDASGPGILNAAPLKRYASNVALPRRNLVLAAPNEAPLMANRELLSALLPRDLLSSLAGEYAPNRPIRIQVV